MTKIDLINWIVSTDKLMNKIIVVWLSSLVIFTPAIIVISVPIQSIIPLAIHLIWIAISLVIFNTIDCRIEKLKKEFNIR